MAKIEKDSNRVVPMYVDNGEITSNGERMIITSPKSFGDIQSLIANLREGQSIIIKLDCVDAATAQRMLDFMSGAAFALGGSLKRIEKSMFLVTRSGMGIMFQE